jgi:hypothetical protein
MLEQSAMRTIPHGWLYYLIDPDALIGYELRRR